MGIHSIIIIHLTTAVVVFFFACFCGKLELEGLVHIPTNLLNDILIDSILAIYSILVVILIPRYTAFNLEYTSY